MPTDVRRDLVREEIPNLDAGDVTQQWLADTFGVSGYTISRDLEHVGFRQLNPDKGKGTKGGRPNKPQEPPAGSSEEAGGSPPGEPAPGSTSTGEGEGSAESTPKGADLASELGESDRTIAAAPTVKPRNGLLRDVDEIGHVIASADDPFTTAQHLCGHALKGDADEATFVGVAVLHHLRIRFATTSIQDAATPPPPPTINDLSELRNRRESTPRTGPHSNIA